MKVLLVLVVGLLLFGTPNTGRAAETYLHARSRLLAKGFKPAPIPRGGEYDQCGTSGEKTLCKRFPELVNCVGMGPDAGTCRMVFVAPNGRFYVVAAYGWEQPNSMHVTGMTWANAHDTRSIKNILAGKPELSD